MKLSVLQLILNHKPMAESARRSSLASKIAAPARSLKNVAKEKFASVKNEEASFDKRFSPLTAESSKFSFRKKSPTSPESELDRNLINTGLSQARYEDPLSNEKFAILEWALLIEDLAKEKNAEPLTPEAQYHYACYLHAHWANSFEAENYGDEKRKDFAERILANIDLSQTPSSPGPFRPDEARVQSFLQYPDAAMELESKNKHLLESLNMHLSDFPALFKENHLSLPTWVDQIRLAQLLIHAIFIGNQAVNTMKQIGLNGKVDFKKIESTMMNALMKEIIQDPNAPWALREKMGQGLIEVHLVAQLLNIKSNDEELNNVAIGLIKDEFRDSFEYNTRELFPTEEAALLQFVYRRISEKYRGSTMHPVEFLMKQSLHEKLDEQQEVKAHPDLKAKVKLDFERYTSVTFNREAKSGDQYTHLTRFLSDNNITEPLKEAALSQLTQSAVLWDGGVNLVKSLFLNRVDTLTKETDALPAYDVGLDNAGMETVLALSSSPEGKHLYVDCKVTLKTIRYTALAQGQAQPTKIEIPSFPLQYRIELLEENGKAYYKVQVNNWDNLQQLLQSISNKVRQEITHPSVTLEEEGKSFSIDASLAYENAFKLYKDNFQMDFTRAHFDEILPKMNHGLMQLVSRQLAQEGVSMETYANALMVGHLVYESLMKVKLASPPSDSDLNDFIIKKVISEFPSSFEYKAREMLGNEALAFNLFMYRRLNEQYLGQTMQPAEALMKQFVQSRVERPIDLSDYPDETQSTQNDIDRQDNVVLDTLDEEGNKIGERLFDLQDQDKFLILEKNLNAWEKNGTLPKSVKEAALKSLHQSGVLWEGGPNLLTGLFSKIVPLAKYEYLPDMMSKGSTRGIKVRNEGGKLMLDCTLNVSQVKLIPRMEEPILYPLTRPIALDYTLKFYEEGGKAYVKAQVKNWSEVQQVLEEISEAILTEKMKEAHEKGFEVVPRSPQQVRTGSPGKSAQDSPSPKSSPPNKPPKSFF